MSHERLDHLLLTPVTGWFPRRATKEDFPQLAELFNIANMGSIPALWNPDAPIGKTWIDMLHSMMFGENGELNYKNIIVADMGGKAVGMLVININPNPWPQEDYSQMKPYVASFSKLRAKVPGYAYIRIIAVLPEHRGLRVATSLLDICFNLAIKSNWPGTFATVHESNILQLEHYHKRGLREIAREPVIEHAAYAPDSQWLLLSIKTPHGFLPKT